MLQAGVCPAAVVQSLVVVDQIPVARAEAIVRCCSGEPATQTVQSAQVSTAQDSSKDKHTIAKGRRMLRAGVPLAAVIQAMTTIDGMSQQAAEHAVGGAGDAGATAKGHRIQSAGVPEPAVLQAQATGYFSSTKHRLKQSEADAAVAVAMSAGSTAPTAEGAIGESDTHAIDPQILNRARRMLSAGVSPGAVAQSLIVLDAMTERSARQTVERCQTSRAGAATADPLVARHSAMAAKYKRMSKAGVPHGAIAQSLAVVDGCSPVEMLDAIQGDVRSDLAAPSSHTCERARRMLSAGVPRDAVLQSLRVIDGLCDPDVLLAVVDQNLKICAAAADVASVLLRRRSGGLESSGAVTTRAARMLKAGVPRGAVAQSLAVLGGLDTNEAWAVVNHPALTGSHQDVESASERACRMVIAGVPVGAVAQSIIVQGDVDPANAWAIAAAAVAESFA